MQYWFNVTTGQEPQVPLHVKEAFYRIAQEAKGDAILHALVAQFGGDLGAHFAAVLLHQRDVDGAALRFAGAAENTERWDAEDRRWNDADSED